MGAESENHGMSKSARKRANKKANKAAETQEATADAPVAAPTVEATAGEEAAADTPMTEPVVEAAAAKEAVANAPATQPLVEETAANEAPRADAPTAGQTEIPEDTKGTMEIQASEDSTACTESPAETSMESAAPPGVDAVVTVTSEAPKEPPAAAVTKEAAKTEPPMPEPPMPEPSSPPPAALPVSVEPDSRAEKAAEPEGNPVADIEARLKAAARSKDPLQIKSARNAAKEAGMPTKEIARIISLAQNEGHEPTRRGEPEPPAPTPAPSLATPDPPTASPQEPEAVEPAETVPKSDVKTAEDAIKAKQRFMELEAKKKKADEAVKQREERREKELQAKRKAAEEAKERREAELVAKRSAAEEAVKAKEMADKERREGELQAKQQAAEEAVKEKRQAELEAKKKAALEAHRAKAASEEKRGAELDAKRKAAEEVLKVREAANKEKRDAELQAKRKAAEESVKAAYAIKAEMARKDAELQAKPNAVEESVKDGTDGKAAENAAAMDGKDRKDAELQAKRKAAEESVKAEMARKDTELQAKRKAAEESVKADMARKEKRQAELEAKKKAAEEALAAREAKGAAQTQSKFAELAGKFEKKSGAESEPKQDDEPEQPHQGVAHDVRKKAVAEPAAEPAAEPEVVDSDDDMPPLDSEDRQPVKPPKLLKPVRGASLETKDGQVAPSSAKEDPATPEVEEVGSVAENGKDATDKPTIGDDDDDMPPLESEDAPPSGGARVKDAAPKRKYTPLPPRTAEPNKGAESSNAESSTRRGPFPDEIKAALELLDTARGSSKEEAEAGVSLAQLYLDSAQFAEAERIARDAWMIYEEVDDAEGQKGEAQAAKIVVKTYLDSEKAEEALKLAQEQTARFKTAGSKMAHAIMSLSLADVHLAMERPKEALKVLAAAQDSLKGFDEDVTLVKVLCMLATANAKVAPTKSLSTAEEALMCVQRLGHFKEQAAVLLVASKVHQSRTEMQEAYNCGDSSLNIAREVGCRRAEAAALKDVADVCLAAQSEQELATKYINEAIGICEELGDFLGEVAARQVAANWCLVAGKHDDAKQMVMKALEVARMSTDRRQVRGSVELLVAIFAQEGKLAEVLDVVKEEGRLAKESKDIRRELSAFQTIAGVQLALEQPVAALHTAETAMEVLGKSGDKKVEAWCLQLLAEVYFSSQRFEDAVGVALKAQNLLREAGDVRAAVGVLDLLFAVYYQMGNEAGALRARVESRLTYQQVGWKDEEAVALLQIAEIVSQVNGPKEAFKSIKEAVQIYKDTQDTRGEAQALIMLSRAQMMAKMATEALRTTVSARTLFKLLNDSSGQAQAMQTAAEVYVENGAYEEAVRVTKQARGLYQKASDAKGEAEALQAIANVYMTVLSNNNSEGRVPRKDAVKDALSATTDWINHLQKLGDAEKQVQAIIQLSKLYRANNEGQKALQAAQEAVEKATSLDEAPSVASAVLAVAEAHLLLGNKQEAGSSADDAAQLWEQLGNSEMINTARRIAEEAKRAPSRPMNGRPPPPGGNEDESFRELKISNAGRKISSGFSKISQADSDRGSANAFPKATDGRGMEAQERRPRRGFSEIAAQKETEQCNDDNGHNSYPPAPAPSQSSDASRSEPNQERRRREMMASFTSKTGPPPQVALENNPLWAVLHAVRPDWNASELRVVADKLSSIQISTAQELFSQLRINGVNGVNEKLRDAGKRQIKPETLQALLAYGNRDLPQMLD